MSSNAIWGNEPGRLEKTRLEAKVLKGQGKKMEAHSMMLSIYITMLGGDPVEGRHPIKFGLLALWHALCMFLCWRQLNHNQLDVLVQFLLEGRRRLPLVTVGKPFQSYRWHTLLDWSLIQLATRELSLAQRDGITPHQLALAYMTSAEVGYATNFWFESTKDTIEIALALENKIRSEPGQPQGLRQLVRILRKAGELWLCLSYPKTAWVTLNQALKLAQGEAKCPDQVPKIQGIMKKIK